MTGRMRDSLRRLGLAVLAVLVLASPLASQSRPLVVIDAGHGGVDPGARGPAGTREKDVALRIARELAARLREEDRYEVRLTRDSDPGLTGGRFTIIYFHLRPRCGQSICSQLSTDRRSNASWAS